MQRLGYWSAGLASQFGSAFLGFLSGLGARWSIEILMGKASHTKRGVAARCDRCVTGAARYRCCRASAQARNDAAAETCFRRWRPPPRERQPTVPTCVVTERLADRTGPNRELLSGVPAEVTQVLAPLAKPLQRHGFFPA
jgi:hypothetical protein